MSFPHSQWFQAFFVCSLFRAHFTEVDALIVTLCVLTSSNAIDSMASCTLRCVPSLLLLIRRLIEHSLDFVGLSCAIS